MRDNLVRVFEDKRYDYDGHGRLTEKRSGKHTVQRFEWDDEHRLIAVHTTRISPAKAKRPAQGGGAAPQSSQTTRTTQTTRFDYDALGRRIAKHDAFGRTEFIWEGLRLIEERRGANVTAYVYEPGSYVPLARIDATGEPTDAGGLGTTGDAPLSANDATHGIEPGTAGEVECGSGNESAAEPPPSNIYYFHTDQVGLPEELTDTQATSAGVPPTRPGATPWPNAGRRPQGRGGGLRRRRRATGDRTEPAVPGPVPGPRYRAALQHLPLLRSGYRAVHLAGSDRTKRWHQPVRVWAESFGVGRSVRLGGNAARCAWI
ncbi:MAG: RHS domain-containing protein [Sterolibacteriaceae bacterium]|nr:RHS domain-containing protein [Candidatus Methylophosphatis haderslevensis]